MRSAVAVTLGLVLAFGLFAAAKVLDQKEAERKPVPVMGYGIQFSDPKRPSIWVEGIGFQWPSKDCIVVLGKRDPATMGGATEYPQVYSSCGVMALQRMPRPEQPK